MQGLLRIADLQSADLFDVLDLSAAAKRDPQSVRDIGSGRVVAVIFEKPSLRTRNSSEVAIVQLGGHPLTMFRDEVGLGLREPVADVARVLG